MTNNKSKNPIQDWIDNNGPYGLERLAVKAGLSRSLIEKAKAGRTPAKISSRRKLAEALGLSIEELFPETQRAS